MRGIGTNALVLWLVTALSIMGFVAGFTIGVDPFGYFGTNRIGYFFSSERQFKYNLVKRSDYNAILLGDSRMAYTDTLFIKSPGLKFLNGGIGGSALAEQLNLLKASRLNRLKLVVVGMQYSDLSHCSGEANGEGGRISDTLRFAATWSQFGYAARAIVRRALGRSPIYHDDGTRSAASRALDDSKLTGRTERYWDIVNANIPREQTPNFTLGARCRELLREFRGLSESHGFTLVVVLLPRNDDMIARTDWGPRSLELARLVAEVRTEVPHVVDLSVSSFSDSSNFWRDDPLHFKPKVGARIIEEAIEQSMGGISQKSGVSG